ncbi:MAG: sensor domain-containing diguanylate cyclase [Phycisphaeraceae bacterium]|nr:sensor domain-containing diguanylate cyclase [Phycisphaeraceae bacterium]
MGPQSGQGIDFEQFYGHMLDQLVDGVYLVDAWGIIRYWNRQAELLTGYPAAEVVGRACSDNILCHVDETGQCLCMHGCPMRAAMADSQERQVEAYLRHRDGHRVPVHIRAAPLHDVNGRVVGCVHCFSDNTAGRFACDTANARPADPALIDSLTGLANRRHLERELIQSLAQLQQGGPAFSLILADIDYFHRFNDCYGYQQGDRLLKLLADTLSHTCRCHDTPYRLADDQLLILARCSQSGDLARFAERIRVLVGHSLLSENGRALCVSISVGATLARPQDTTASLMNRASRLLHQSKQAGRNRVTCDPAVNVQAA